MKLFFRIFAIFWVAQSLIVVITTALIVRQHFPNPGPEADLGAALAQDQARSMLLAYTVGGCPGLASYSRDHGLRSALADASGHALCGPLPDLETGDLNMYAGRISARFQPGIIVWNLPVKDASGHSFTCYLIRPNIQPRGPRKFHYLHFAFPQLFVAVGVGGVTTFALVVLFTRPLVRLRKATGELARGNLGTRVPESNASSRFGARDEYAALVHDFNNMAERLETLVGAQQTLLRDVSHELRSPLARLSVALELAREDGVPETEAHLDRIEQEAAKLNALIGQLLQLSSMEALEKVHASEEIDLESLLHEMIADAGYEARQRHCTVVLTQTAPLVVSGNRDLLYRAIENVIRNAIRHTAEGTAVEVALSAQERAPERGAAPIAIVDVLDHGPGIPENCIGEVFRPFYRVDSARTPGAGGFGVGLAITERAITLHGGHVSISNRAGGGAAVRLSLPLIAAHAGAGPAAEQDTSTCASA